MIPFSANDLIKSPKHLSDKDNSIEIFSERVKNIGLEHFKELKREGDNTFFLPVDNSFDNILPILVDRDVVHSHTLPGQRIFTRPGNRRTDYLPTEKCCSSMSLSVMSRIVHNNNSTDSRSTVESLTIVGSMDHRRSLIRAVIVKGNIPVTNGIVHLISRPLVVTDDTLGTAITQGLKV